ncbi:hypothetical protein GCM10027447_04330 [Glycomyces halotolerans]
MFGEDAIAQQLAEARSALRSAAQSPEDDQVGEVTAEGADGRLRVTIGPDGRVERFELDPRLMREGSQYLAEELKTAVNAAMDDRAAAMQTDEPVPDMEAVDATLEDLQDRSMRQMREMSASINDVMRKLHGRE